ncbi:MAG: hypothetical protein N2257_10435, partial [Thermodesulfovibrionales bacterium]|nr:hypothetical protein [Thermodesulfovibrionales bacterium]
MCIRDSSRAPNTVPHRFPAPPTITIASRNIDSCIVKLEGSMKVIFLKSIISVFLKRIRNSSKVASVRFVI